MPPRTRLCWLCGRKFRGNHYTEVVIDGHPRELYKECAKDPDYWAKIKGVAKNENADF